MSAQPPADGEPSVRGQVMTPTPAPIHLREPLDPTASQMCAADRPQRRGLGRQTSCRRCLPGGQIPLRRIHLTSRSGTASRVLHERTCAPCFPRRSSSAAPQDQPPGWLGRLRRHTRSRSCPLPAEPHLTQVLGGQGASGRRSGSVGPAHEREGCGIVVAVPRTPQQTFSKEPSPTEACLVPPPFSRRPPHRDRATERPSRTRPRRGRWAARNGAGPGRSRPAPGRSPTARTGRCTRLGCGDQRTPLGRHGTNTAPQTHPRHGV
jgi:hypothetical protein